MCLLCVYVNIIAYVCSWQSWRNFTGNLKMRCWYAWEGVCDALYACVCLYVCFIAYVCVCVCMCVPMCASLPMCVYMCVYVCAYVCVAGSVVHAGRVDMVSQES